MDDGQLDQNILRLDVDSNPHSLKHFSKYNKTLSVYFKNTFLFEDFLKNDLIV